MTGVTVPHLLPVAAIAELEPHQYVGLIDDAAVALLTVRLASEGLLTPVWVRRNGNRAAVGYSIIAGRHRLRAAVALGWTEIEAVEMAAADSGNDQLRRLQVAENLDRRHIRPIERACHIMVRWQEAASAVGSSAPHNQQSEASRARWEAHGKCASHASAADTRRIDEAAGAACGVTDRTIRDYRTLHTAIVAGLPDLFAALNAHPLGESRDAMLRLAKQNPTARRIAAAYIIAHPDCPTMDEALIAAGQGRKDIAAHDAGTRVLNSYDRLPLRHKRTFALGWAENTPITLVEEIMQVWRDKGRLP